MKIALSLSLLVTYLVAVSAVDPWPFSEMVLFGDSLVDVGNLNSIDPTRPKRFTNGKVVSEYINQELMFSEEIKPSLHLIGQQAGNNYAVGGAKVLNVEGDRTITNDLINFKTQIDAYLLPRGGIVPDDTLIMINIGTNDLFQAGNIVEDTFGTFGDDDDEDKKKGKTGKRGKKLNRNDGGRRHIRKLKKGGKKVKVSRDFLDEYIKKAEARVLLSVDEEVTQVERLLKAGAKYIVVFGKLNIGIVPQNYIKAVYYEKNGMTPEDVQLGKMLHEINLSLSTLYTKNLFQRIEAERLPFYPDAQVLLPDFLELIDGILGQIPDNGFDYGPENPCLRIFGAPGYNVPSVSPDCNPIDPNGFDGFTFYDDIHATTAVYKQWAEYLLEEMKAKFLS